MGNQSEMIVYQTEDGLTKVNVTFEADTVWLSLDQMAELFQRDKSVISRHIHEKVSPYFRTDFFSALVIHDFGPLSHTDF